MEGLWRHLKHDDSGIPEEVRADDERLNMYVQVYMWRRQICGDPFSEVLRMCRAFRSLPREQQELVWKHGLRSKASKASKGSDKREPRQLPPVAYLTWGADSGEKVAPPSTAGSGVRKRPAMSQDSAGARGKAKDIPKSRLPPPRKAKSSKRRARL